MVVLPAAFHTDGTGVPLPEGLLDRAETIAEWERLRGRPATHVDFYEKLEASSSRW